MSTFSVNGWSKLTDSGPLEIVNVVAAKSLSVVVRNNKDESIKIKTSFIAGWSLTNKS